ncbi:MAG: PAS domain-containing protein [Coleofasciculaceae cyanobacterium SM2_3_26]|nr:PAS domain-containing protein [Coleofasciculaceae cyanobacterium SM2_3_26]
MRYSTLPRWKEILGYSEADSLPNFQAWCDRVHPEDLPTVLEALQQHLYQQEPYFNQEYRMQCRDGSYKWILDRGQATLGRRRRTHPHGGIPL